MLALAAGCSRAASEEARNEIPKSESTAPNAAVNPFPDSGGDWVRPAKDFASTRFSSLDEINRETVKNLGVKVTFSTGYTRGHEAAPLVVQGTMYLVTPFPNVLYALDLTRPGAPMKWKYEPKPVAAAQGVACCDVVNRGAVFADGAVFFNTLDGRTISVDAETGQPRWIATLGNVSLGETITMAPLVVKDRVLVGNSGGELGVRGWLAALDSATGRIAWRAYHTGPDRDILIGPRFKPFHEHTRGISACTPGQARRGSRAAALPGAGSRTTRT